MQNADILMLGGGIIGWALAEARRRVCQARRWPTGRGTGGFSLVEVLLSVAIFVIVVVALLAAFLGYSYLNANAKAMQLAMNDATRIMEQIRTQNTSCVAPYPSIKPPGFESWEAWLNAQSSGKSLGYPYEFVTVTCQDQTSTVYCGPNQMGQNEWHRPGPDVILDPLRVTVSIGYVVRVFGGGTASGPEFTYTSALIMGGLYIYYGPDQNNNRIIESNAMLTTSVTCR